MLVIPAQLADMLRVDPADPLLEFALQSAQAELEGWAGCDFDEKTHTWKHTLTWWDARQGWVELPIGPATALVVVKLDGADWLANCQLKANGYLSWQDAALPAPPEGQLEVTYKTGWNSSNVPEGIRNAILHLGAKWYARPDPSITNQSLGAASGGYINDLPPPIRNLVLRHTKLRVVQ